MFRGQRRFAPKIELIIAAGQDTLHRVGGGMSGC
jgi:hypothetical protein